jgi:hypothetical protein
MFVVVSKLITYISKLFKLDIVVVCVIRHWTSENLQMLFSGAPAEIQQKLPVCRYPKRLYRKVPLAI